MIVVNILGTIDDKIENLELINTKLQQLIKLDFIKKYRNLDKNNLTTMRSFINNIIAGDWGKECEEGNYSKCVICIRGADLPNLKTCKITSSPKRFIIEKNFISKKLKDYDFIVEMSGGSPTQSTGRTAFIPEGFNSEFNNLICTNFCKAIRCENKYLSVFCYLLFDMWYDSDLFFNYEIGTTGLKNFNLDAVLDINIKQPNDDFLQNIYEKFKAANMIVLDNSLKINKLTELKQLYLKKFFN